MAFFMVGCQSPSTTRVSPAPVPTTPVAQTDEATRPLQAGDVVDVRIDGEADLGRAYTLDRDGRIDMPMAGSVLLAGVTPAAAADAIATSYRHGYLVDPKVTVVRKIPRPVYVTGDVDHAGSQNWQAGLSAASAAITAGRKHDTASYTVVRNGRALALKPDDTLLQGDVLIVGAAQP